MQGDLKKRKAKLDLLTNIDTLLIMQKSIRAEICHGIHWYLKANKKYMKDNDKNKKPPYLKYWEVNNVYGWAISQNLPLGCFKWVEEISQSNKGFIKSYNLDSDMEYFLEGDITFLRKHCRHV